MARIKRVTKISRSVNVCSEENTERKTDKSLVDVNHFNNRKICNNDRNRRILLSLRSYPNLYQSYYIPNFNPTMRKYLISTSTQTSQNSSKCEKISAYTQTHLPSEKYKIFKKNENAARRSVSDGMLIKNRNQWHKSRKYESNEAAKKELLEETQEELKEKEKNKTLIFLHRNERIAKCRMGNKTKAKLKSKTHRRRRKPFHAYRINRKIRNMALPQNNENLNHSSHRFIYEMSKFSLLTLADWSSKLFRMFSDLGMRFTESLTNFYKHYEFQRYQSSTTECHCHDFHQKIDQLFTKLDRLETNMHISQAQLQEHQIKLGNTKNLEEKIETIRLKIESYDSLQAELMELKNKLKGNSPAPNIPLKPPPLPPPPPPLPVFSLSTNCASNAFLKVVQKERKLINYENPRPIITLEDILNVKLKKIPVGNM